MKENRKMEVMRCDYRQCDGHRGCGGGDLVVERCLRRGSLSWPVEVELAWKETRKVGECSSGPFFALGIESVPKVTF